MVTTVMPPPVEITELVRRFREYGVSDASQFIQRRLMDEGPTSNDRNDMETREEYALFGKLLAQAIKVDSPSPFFGRKFGYAATTHATDRWANLFKCRDCGKFADSDAETTIYAEGERRICGNCAPNYIHSPLQNMHILREGSLMALTGPDTVTPVSPRFAERNCVSHGGMWYSRDHYDMIREALRGKPRKYDEFENVFSPQVSGMYGYHTSKEYVERLPSPAFDKLATPLLVGIELEVELAEDKRWNKTGDDPTTWRDAAARDIKGVLNGEHGEEHYALVEGDGSIHYGFEIVTGWTGLDTHERLLGRMRSKEFETIVKKYGMKSHDTTTCGLHVTVDRAGMSLLHMGKFQVFFNSPKNTSFIDQICRRSATNYAKKKHEKFGKVANVAPTRGAALARDKDRYEIANFHGNKYAIEFRGPRGTLRFETIMASMEFIRLVWMFTKNASIQDLNALSFMDFVWRREHAHESQYLRAYMLERKIAPEEHIEPVEGRRLTVTESLVDALAMGFIATSKDS